MTKNKNTDIPDIKKLGLLLECDDDEQYDKRIYEYMRNNEESSKDLYDIATLNTILMQVVLFKQRAALEEIIPTVDGIIMFVRGLIIGYPEEDVNMILALIEGVESYTEKVITEIIEDVEFSQKNKITNIKFC